MKPVVDVEALLAPIPGENPAGESLQYSGLYDAIREARRSEDPLEQGEWKRAVELADWRQVEHLATDALAHQTKDLRVCAWLGEALVKLHGFVGLRDGLQLARGLHERYWDDMYPKIDEGDLEARANSLSWLDRQLSLAIKEVLITQSRTGIDYSFLDYEDTKRFVIPEKLDDPDSDEIARITECKRRTAEEGRVTSEEWAKAKAVTTRAFYEETFALLNECWAEFEALDRVVDEKYDRQRPGLDAIKRSLDDLRLFAERTIQEKRACEAERSAPEAAPAAAELAADALTSAVTIHFTAYYPVELRPDVWDSLLVYAHVPGALGAVQSDSQMLLGPRAKDRKRRHGVATKMIERGTEITVVPEMPGCRCNPPRASFLWLEDWHRIEFRLQASPSLPGFEWGAATNGRVAFYVGPILVGEVEFWALFSPEADESPHQFHDKKTTALYQSIFVSYSHKDKHIVELLESAYTVLGFEYLRDLKILRSGEEWNPALLGKIEEADIFQLYWSSAAKQSAYVEQEWHHALELERHSFIRPVYWEMPLPEPPPELRGIHFARLDFIQQPP